MIETAERPVEAPPARRVPHAYAWPALVGQRSRCGKAVKAGPGGSHDPPADLCRECWNLWAADEYRRSA